MTEDGTDDDDRLDGFVGDGREKYLVAHTTDGERVGYGDTYVKHAADAYAVSDDPAFPPEETERLSKADLARVEVDQHHSTCFITTAAGDESDLAVLRGSATTRWPRRASADHAAICGRPSSTRISSTSVTGRSSDDYWVGRDRPNPPRSDWYMTGERHGVTTRGYG